MEQFHSALTGLAAECEFGALEPQIVRDLFVTRVNAPEKQRKICAELTTPEDVLRQALAWERGVNNQRKLVKSTLGKGDVGLNIGLSDDTADSALHAQSSSGVKTEPLAAVRSQQRNSNPRESPATPCRNCGREFKPEHHQPCPARGVQCRSCGKRDHFARVCRSAPNPNKPSLEHPTTTTTAGCKILAQPTPSLLKEDALH